MIHNCVCRKQPWGFQKVLTVKTCEDAQDEGAGDKSWEGLRMAQLLRHQEFPWSCFETTLEIKEEKGKN